MKINPITFIHACATYIIIANTMVSAIAIATANTTIPTNFTT